MKKYTGQTFYALSVIVSAVASILFAFSLRSDIQLGFFISFLILFFISLGLYTGTKE